MNNAILTCYWENLDLRIMAYLQVDWGAVLFDTSLKWQTKTHCEDRCYFLQADAWHRNQILL